MHDIIKHINIAFLCGTMLVMAACDATIHEYPHQGKALVIIVPYVDRNPPLYYKEVVYDKDWNRTVKDLEEIPAPHYVPGSEYKMRVILEVYKGTDYNSRAVGSGQYTPVERRELRMDKDALPPQDSINMHLPDGDYYVLAWADYVNKSGSNKHIYNADTLQSVKSNIRNYPKDTDHRSTAAGKQSFAIDFDLGPEGYPIMQTDRKKPVLSRKIPVMLNRPSGRYRVIASDFGEFTKEGGTLEGATVKVIYKRYVSVGYNVATGQPNLFISTYSFNTSPVQTSTGEEGCVSMFGDYLFCNPDKEDTVIADFYFYDSEGNEISHCENIEIPLKQNRETIVKGYFLTKKIGNDNKISIDENFEGEYTVEI